MTFIFAVACAVLLAVGWYIAMNMRGNEPTTLDGVSNEVLAGIDDIQSSLPASAIVSSSDKTGCPRVRTAATASNSPSSARSR